MSYKPIILLASKSFSTFSNEHFLNEKIQKQLPNKFYVFFENIFFPKLTKRICFEEKEVFEDKISYQTYPKYFTENV